MSRLGKRCITTAVAACAVAALAAPVAPAAPTAVAIYSPFSPAGGLAEGLRLAAGGTGTCGTGSFVVSNPFAFRCAQRSRVFDPCYLDGGAGAPVVDCVTAPWATSVMRLRLMQPPSAALGAPPGAPPWALELASGRRCLRATGATTIVRGRRLSYLCDARRVLFGRPDTSAPTWRIRQARGAGGSGMRTVAIAAAWR